MSLPFLETNNWPVMREENERLANPSEHMETQDHLIQELMKAFEHHDASLFYEAFLALIHSIRKEEETL